MEHKAAKGRPASRERSSWDWWGEEYAYDAGAS